MDISLWRGHRSTTEATTQKSLSTAPTPHPHDLPGEWLVLPVKNLTFSWFFCCCNVLTFLTHKLKIMFHHPPSKSFWTGLSYGEDWQVHFFLSSQESSRQETTEWRWLESSLMCSSAGDTYQVFLGRRKLPQCLGWCFSALGSCFT